MAAEERSNVFPYIFLYDTHSVLIIVITLVLMLLVFSILFGIFRYLAYKTPEYYHRKDHFFKSSGFSSVRVGDSGFKWLWKCYFWSSEEIYKNLGIDSLILIKTQRTMLLIAFIIFIPAVFVLLPIHIYFGSTTLDFLTRTTITSIPSESPLLWIHFVMMYFETIVIFIVLFLGWKDVAKWKQKYFSDNPISISTLLFQHVNYNASVEVMQNQLNRQLGKIARDNNSYIIYILRDYGYVKPLIKKHDKELEAKRNEDKSELSLHSCANLSNSSLTPTLNGSNGGISNSLDRVTENYTLLKEASRVANTMFLPAAVVIVSDLGLAQTLRCASVSGDQRKSKITLCPPAENIIWDNLRLGLWQRRTSVILMGLITSVVIFFWALPVTLVVIVAKAVILSDQFNANLPDDPNFVIFIQYFFVTILPLFLINIFVILLPYGFAYITKKEGHVSQTNIDFNILTKICAFNIFDTFFVFTLSASFLQNIKSMIENPLEISKILAMTIPLQFNFYLLYISMNGLIIAPWGLLQGNRLILSLFGKLRSFILRRPLSIDPIYPLSGGYITKYSKLFSLFGIGLLFNVISPLITVVWVIFLLIAYACTAYDQENNEYPLFSYNGDFWIRVSNWIVIYAVISHCLLLGVFSLKSFQFLTFLSIPCPIISVVLAVCLKSFFKRLFDYPTLEVMGELDNLSFEMMSKKQKDYHIEEMIPPINLTEKEYIWEKVAKCYETNESNESNETS